jgi:glucosamine-6-phosphate deaminase
MKPHKEFTADRLAVKIFDGREQMGRYAATEVASRIKELLQSKDQINIIFAAAPSQNEFLEALARAQGIAWGSVNAFHMDEYIGLAPGHPQRFGHFLKERIFDKVGFKAVYFLDAEGQTPGKNSAEYTALLRRFPPDIVCMGIGENTHIAFNDPHVADFADPELVKPVRLDVASRQQQVNDGCFTALSEVPETAVTLTVPALMQATYVYCMVPGTHKAEAIYHTLHDRVSETYPSTVLREHPHAILYLDRESASKINS